MTQKSKTVKVKKSVKTAVKAQKVVKAKTTIKKETVVASLPPVAVTPPVVVPPPVVPKQNEAEVMWNEIRNLPIQMFGLPNQTVGQHCSFYAIDPNQLYLVIRSSATLPSLEAAIAPRFVVELVDKFVLVKRVPQTMFPAKK